MSFHPIRNDSDYQAALQEVESLFQSAPGTPEFDRLDILSTLVEAYELVHHRIEMPDPIEAIHYYLDTRGLSHSDLEQYIGDSSSVVEVLSRRRPLTLEMIRQLNKGLGIPAEVLIQNYEPAKTLAS